MHDPQWMPWPSRLQDPEWPKGFHYDWYPETVQLWVNPKGGDGRYPYNKSWLTYLRSLQKDEQHSLWIARIAAGLFNKGNQEIPILNLNQLSEEPVAESISSGGNVIRILEIKNGSARIEMLYFRDNPPAIGAVNYWKTPWLVTKFTAISYDGGTGLTGGLDVYFPNLAREKCGYWVDLERVELFPTLSLEAKSNQYLNVQAAPNKWAPMVGWVTAGSTVTILEYMPQGSEVWGRIQAGWIPLQTFADGVNPVFTTSWTMETQPPILLSQP
jgi:hypothetical protein